jgi:hypothetical protein
MLMGNMGLYRNGATFGQQFIGVLDQLSTPSAAAYSLRKLRIAYTGPAIRVRRTNNNEANIGFATAVQTRTNLAAIPINNDGGETAPGVTMTTVGTGTEFGQPYIDVRWQGTASAAGFLQFTHSAPSAFNPAIHAPVTPGLTYTASIGFRLVSGTAPSEPLVMRGSQRTNAGVPLGATAFVSLGPATSTLQRRAAIEVAAANAAFMLPNIYMFVPSGTEINFTMRFYAANVEEGIGNARPLLQRNVPEVVADIGDLDTAALMAFVSDGNGFVTTWYDQSGNGRHAIQTTATSQPQIVSNGVIETQNRRPTVVQSNQVQTLPISATFTGLTSATGVFVFRQLTGNAGAHDFRFQSSGDNNHSPFETGIAFDSFFSALRQTFNSYGPNTKPSTTTLTIHTARQTGTALQVFKNGTQIDVDKSVPFQLPVRQFLFSPESIGTATLSEGIVFGTAISTTNRQTLERNQGTYYGITVT